MAGKFSSSFILSPSPVRLAFCHLVTPKVDKRGKNKFGATLLIPKSSPTATLKDDPALAAYRDLVSQVLKAMRPNGPYPAKLGIRDGSQPNSNGNVPDGFKDHWIIGCSGNYPVALYAANAQKTMDEGLFRAGNWAIAQLNAFWFDVDNSQGVSFGLGAVQFHHEGQKLGANAPAPNFSAVPGSAAAAGGAPTGDNPADMFGN